MSKVHHNAGRSWGRPYVKAVETAEGVENVNPGQWVMVNGKLSRLGHNNLLVPPAGKGKKSRVSMLAFQLSCGKDPRKLMTKAKRRSTVDQLLDLFV